ncbi:MAG: DUF5666 domain-containing protein, partial [Gammaproteobacteria bacterium]
GGTGGTGITTGTLQGYGSIFVNDVEYDVSDAVFLRNGLPASNGEDDYSVGEVITIRGNVSADGKTGTAEEVVYKDLLKGRVTLATPDYIRVLGQDVMVDGKTVFVGFTRLDRIEGRYVEVSGFTTADGAILATNIKVKSESEGENEISGVITAVGSDNSFSIGSLVVEYSSFPGGTPEVGQIVEVKIQAVISIDRVLALEIEFVESEDYEEETRIEIEGLVTTFESITDFQVDGFRITTDSGTEYEDGTSADLGVDVRVQVKGLVDVDGFVLAEEIRIKVYTIDNQEVEVVATIDNLNPGSSSFVILGLVAETDVSTEFEDESSADDESFGYEDLAVGDRVEVEGMVTGGNTMRVEEVNRRDPSSRVSLEAALTQYSEGTGELVIGGISVHTDSSTEFQGPNGKEITAESFFKSLVEGVTDLEVRGTAEGSSILADTIEIDD